VPSCGEKNCDAQFDWQMFSLNPVLVEIAPPDTGGLLAQAQAGDAEAFGEVCRAYETRLLRQAMALCGDAVLAEDLAQDTLVEAWRCLRRYNGSSLF
jgi:RNA polymerase sigma-70 factor (ECF subfamily)